MIHTSHLCGASELGEHQHAGVVALTGDVLVAHEVHTVPLKCGRVQEG